MTSAPLMIDLLDNIPFVMGSDYNFADRFDAERNYFVPTNARKEVGGFINWETNFIAMRARSSGSVQAKGYGVNITSFHKGGSTLVGHTRSGPWGVTTRRTSIRAGRSC